MKTKPLLLEDLVPVEAEFKLSGFDQTLTLSKWSLRVRAWAFEKYGAENLQKFFENKDILKISEIAFFLLKDKSQIKTLEQFQDLIVTIEDQVNLLKAVIKTIGVGEPQIDQLQKLEAEANQKNPND